MIQKMENSEKGGEREYIIPPAPDISDADDLADRMREGREKDHNSITSSYV